MIRRSMSVILTAIVAVLPFEVVAATTPSVIGGTLTERYIGASSSSDSFSYDTTSTGSNRALIVMCTNQSGQFETSATYNGVSMTKLTSGSNAIFGQTMFYLANPATGANTLTINYTATIGHFCHVFTLQDVDQTTLYQAFIGMEKNPGTSVTLTATTTVANQLVVSWIGAANAITVGGGQSTAYNAKPGSYFMALSTSTPDTTTTVTHTYSFSSGFYSSTIVSFLPVTGAAAPTPSAWQNIQFW